MKTVNPAFSNRWDSSVSHLAEERPYNQQGVIRGVIYNRKRLFHKLHARTNFEQKALAQELKAIHNDCGDAFQCWEPARLQNVFAQPK